MQQQEDTLEILGCSQITIHSISQSRACLLYLIQMMKNKVLPESEALTLTNKPDFILVFESKIGILTLNS